jgi:hypothetical protein
MYPQPNSTAAIKQKSFMEPPMFEIAQRGDGGTIFPCMLLMVNARVYPAEPISGPACHQMIVGESVSPSSISERE